MELGRSLKNAGQDFVVRLNERKSSRGQFKAFDEEDRPRCVPQCVSRCTRRLSLAGRFAFSVLAEAQHLRVLRQDSEKKSRFSDHHTACTLAHFRP